MNLDYIVTGTGRCGTVYTARVLSSIGISCGHEVIFDYTGIQTAEERLRGGTALELSITSRVIHDGEHSKHVPPYLDNLNDLRADSSYMAAPYLNHPCLKDASVIHVVRNPILVVNSFVNYLDYFTSTEPASVHGKRYEKYIFDHMPELQRPMTNYQRAVLYWVNWNETIEWNSKGKQYVRIRAEEGPLPLLRWLGKEPQSTFDDRTINTYRKPFTHRFALDDLEDGEIKERFISLGVRYGYAMSKKVLL